MNTDKQLSFIFASVVATIMMLLVAACSNDAPAPVQPVSVATVHPQTAQRTSPPSTPQQLAAGEAASETQAECQVGQTLAPQDRCTYPGTSDDFWVDESGNGHFLFFTASSVINAQNANINNQSYDFSARKQADGSWIIETTGAPSDSVRVSDLIAVARDAPTPTAVPAQRQAVDAAPSAAPAPPMSVASPVSATVSVSKLETTPQPSPTTPLAPAPANVSPKDSRSTPIPLATVPAAAGTKTSVGSPTPAPTPSQAATTDVSDDNPGTAPTPSTTMTAQMAAATPFAKPTPSGVASSGPNRPPQVIPNIGNQTVGIHDSLTLDISRAFTDPDGDELGQYSVIISDTAVAHGRVNSVTGELTLEGLGVGTSWVTLKACDAYSCTGLGDLTFLLTVVPHRNLPPKAVRAVEDRSIGVGENIVVSISSAFHDLDGDRIVGYDFRMDNGEIATGTVNSSAGIITFHGTQVGSSAVSVVACDGEGCGADETALHFMLNVVPPPNQLPVAIGSIADQEMHVGEIIVLDVSSLFSDPEGDPIREYAFSQTNRNVAVGEMESHTGSLTLRGAETGTTTVAVDASDSSIVSVRPDLKFRVTVTEPLRNPPKVVGQISDQAVELGKSIEVPVAHAFDAPRDYRIIRYDFLLKNPEVSEDSEITRAGVLTLEGAEKGKSWVFVRACSYVGCSNFSDLEFVLIVEDPDEEPNNSPEVVGALLDQRLVVGESVTLNVSKAFSDPDDDRIVDYKYEMSHPYYAIGSSITDTGILKLHASNVGTTKVSISACDDEDECSDPDDMNFTLTVDVSPGELQLETAKYSSSDLSAVN